jgi:hypothetical protein
VNPQQRAIAAAIAAVLVVLVIAVITRVIGPRTESPRASSSPNIAAASATPSATVGSPSATALSPGPSATASTTDARYGYLAVGGGGFAVVDESGTTIQQYGCGAPGRGCNETMLAVSPDGRRVAFWLSGQTPLWEVRVFDVAAPTAVRTVVTLPEGFEGLGMAWATDSRGLLFASQTVGYGGITGGAGRATLSAVDVTTPGPATDVMPTRTDGAFYRPLAWDRTRNVVAAVTSGEGGYVGEYTVKEGDRYSATRAKAGQFLAWQLDASPDGTRVLAIDLAANVLRIWPVTNFAGSFEVRPGPGGRISAARWRSAREVAWSYGERLDVFVPQTDTSRTVYTASGDVRLVALRPDGTGALVASGGSPNVSAGMVNLDMATGAATSRPAMDIGQVVVPRGVLR